MLQFEEDGLIQTLDCDNYYIQSEWDGADNVLHLTLPARHPQMLSITERMQLRESGDGLVYRVSKYDRGKSSLDIEAELDLDELCAGVLIGWTNRVDENTVMGLAATVENILTGKA